MFKQIFKFSLGVGLGVSIFYVLRRFLTGSNLPPQPQLPAVKPTEPAEAPRTGTKFTVRTSGPRPQAPSNGSGEGSTSAADASGESFGGASKSEIAEAPAIVETSEAPDLTPEVEIPRRMMSAADEQDASGTGEMVETMTGAADTETAVTELNQSVASGNDDFEIINDIGPIFTNRLHEAGVKSFRELADMSAEEIAQIVRVPASRVINNRWREQSARLAEGLPLEESDNPS